MCNNSSRPALSSRKSLLNDCRPPCGNPAFALTGLLPIPSAAGASPSPLRLGILRDSSPSSSETYLRHVILSGGSHPPSSTIRQFPLRVCHHLPRRNPSLAVLPSVVNSY